MVPDKDGLLLNDGPVYREFDSVDLTHLIIASPKLSGRTHRCSQLLVIHEPVHRVDDFSRLPSRDHERTDAILENVFCSSGWRCYDRQTCRHRFKESAAKALRKSRKHKDV